jgi:hypothetical protein
MPERFTLTEPDLEDIAVGIWVPGAGAKDRSLACLRGDSLRVSAWWAANGQCDMPSPYP